MDFKNFKVIKDYIYKLLIFIGFFFLITVFIEIPGYILEEYEVNDYFMVSLIVLYFIFMALVYMAFNYMFEKYNLPTDRDSSFSKVGIKLIKGFLIFVIIRIAWMFIYDWLFIKLGLALPKNEISLMEAEGKMRTLTDFMAIVQAPIFEELLFRKLLMHLFFNKNRGIIYEIVFVIFSAFIFALAHDQSFGANFFLAYMASGTIYSIAYRKTKDIIRVPIGVHMVSNLIASI